MSGVADLIVETKQVYSVS